jgi:hypothetical protein
MPVEGVVVLALVPAWAPAFVPVPVGAAAPAPVDVEAPVEAPVAPADPPLVPAVVLAAVVVPVPALALGPVVPSVAQATANGSAKLAMASVLSVWFMVALPPVDRRPNAVRASWF